MSQIQFLFVLIVLAFYASARVIPNSPFSAPLWACPQLPPHTATSINDLRPNDIKVVMAMGDSITAAFGLEGFDGGFYEYRGQSWSIGVDPGAGTVANYFKHFVPGVIGGSVGYHIPELCYDILCPSPHYPQQDKLNGAQSGAWFQNIPGQVDYLVAQMKANPNINMTEDWKVITLFIGANNLCVSCLQILDPIESANEFELYMTEVLNRIQQKIPRVFVNMVQIFNVSQVYKASLNSTYCADVHRVIFIECACAFTEQKYRDQMDVIGTEYNKRMAKVVNEFAKKGYKDFAAVLQPAFINSNIPDISFLSSLDCFHPSKLAHEVMAIALWNNMLTPAAQKQTKLPWPNPQPICPTANTLLYTY